MIARGHFGEASVELHPPRLRVLVLVETKRDETDHPPKYVTLSTKDTVKALCREILAKLSAPRAESYKVWKMPQGEYEGIQLSADKFLSSGAELLEISDKSLEDSLIAFDDSFAVEFPQEGKWISDQLPSANELVPYLQPLFSQDNDFFTKLGSSSRSTQQQQQWTPLTSSSSSFAKSKETQITPFMSQGFSKMRAVQEPGTLGLGNMYVVKFASNAVLDRA